MVCQGEYRYVMSKLYQHAQEEGVRMTAELAVVIGTLKEVGIVKSTSLRLGLSNTWKAVGVQLSQDLLIENLLLHSLLLEML
jgi:hypothetical protein